MGRGDVARCRCRSVHASHAMLLGGRGADRREKLDVQQALAEVSPELAPPRSAPNPRYTYKEVGRQVLSLGLMDRLVRTSGSTFATAAYALFPKARASPRGRPPSRAWLTSVGGGARTLAADVVRVREGHELPSPEQQRARCQRPLLLPRIHRGKVTRHSLRRSLVYAELCWSALI